MNTTGTCSMLWIQMAMVVEVERGKRPWKKLHEAMLKLKITNHRLAGMPHPLRATNKAIPKVVPLVIQRLAM